jgi:hypothetical protein
MIGSYRAVEDEMRDDFPKRVVETLAKRVGNRCSNPGCRKRTSGPHTQDVKALNVGVAAHITAASAGGPRYDPSLTPTQRRAIGNAIWLCQSCAKLVDNDEARYTKDVLLQWRQDAEREALREIESPSGQVSDAGSHSIKFGVDDWKVWRERGNLPGDLVHVIRGWKRGNLRYSCTIRLRNGLEWEEQLYRPRIEFRQGDAVLLSDEYAFTDQEIILPPKRWVSIEVDHGLHDNTVFERADSVWFTAQTVGDNVKHQWRLAGVQGQVGQLSEE